MSDNTRPDPSRKLRGERPKLVQQFQYTVNRALNKPVPGHTAKAAETLQELHDLYAGNPLMTGIATFNPERATDVYGYILKKGTLQGAIKLDMSQGIAIGGEHGELDFPFPESISADTDIYDIGTDIEKQPAYMLFYDPTSGQPTRIPITGQAKSFKGLDVHELKLPVGIAHDSLLLWQRIAALEAEVELLRAKERQPAPEPTPGTTDPITPLSAVQLGQALGGLGDEIVRVRERNGQLFSILRPGRIRGREYPAFQAWPEITGQPLSSVLNVLRSTGSTNGTAAYGFFTSPTELLGGLTPVEALLGRLTTRRPLAPEAQGLLAATPDERQQAVIKAAEAYAAELAL